MVIQGKATPAILRDVLRAEVGPDDAAGLRDTLLYTIDLLEKQQSEIDMLFDRHNFDGEAVGNALSAFVSEIRDLTDRVDRLDGATRRLENRVQQLQQLVNEYGRMSPTSSRPRPPAPTTNGSSLR